MKKILIIEDDIDSAKLVALNLQSLGCEVEIAIGGVEGLKKIRDWKPDLITLDIEMPDKTGLDILHELSVTPGLDKIPVVIITVKDDFRTKQEAKKYLQLKGYFLKPVDFYSLLSIIKENM